MTQHIAARPRAVGSDRPESRLRSYARLGKLDVYDYYLSIVLVLSAVLLPAARFGAADAGTLVVFLLGEVFVMMGLVAFDDLTGFRDGSDLVNYGPDNPRRRKLRKPLVAGTLSPREAVAFGWVTVAVGGLLWGADLAIATHRPLWTVVLVASLFVISPQYSYGLKISYHGFQEAFLVLLGAALVLAPYGLVTGEFSGFVLVQGVLFGFGPLMFGVYSNTNDVEGDRSVGRPTVAALVSPRGNAIFIGCLSAAEFLLGAVSSLVGIAPWWFVLVMLPATVWRLRQYLAGFRQHDIMLARKRGFTVHRLSVVLLIATNLLAGWGAAG